MSLFSKISDVVLRQTGSGLKLLKVIKGLPGVGLVVGGGFALKRALKKDFDGAGWELASGVASCIPGWGTIFSYSVDVGLAGKDCADSFYKEYGR